MNKKTTALLILASASTWACSFYARGPEDYQKETEQLLSAKNDELKACYDEVLKDSPDAGGIVAVDFTVEAKTGNILDPTLNEEKTTAPSKLGECVITSMQGLALDPPDQRTGVASFTYEFKANEPQQI